jgi:hypothetical protein
MAENSDATGKSEPIRSETLDGDMLLEVYDASRHLAGDRWRVAAVFRLVIPVAAALPPGASATAGPEEIRRLLGDPVVFEKRLAHTFIEADRKDEVMQEMVQRYLDGVRRYMVRPAFARNYVLRRYADALQKSRWYADAPQPGVLREEPAN